MATQAIAQAPEAEQDAAAAPAKGRSVMMMAVAGVLAGVAAGMFGVAPMLAKRHAGAAGGAATHAEEAPAAAAVTHAIENLVLNPAGTAGTRFLMVNATFELKDAAGEQAMKDHEAEVRDDILAVLGKKTMNELTDVTQREAIKQEVVAAVSPLLPKGTILKVFFPQFVIQ